MNLLLLFNVNPNILPGKGIKPAAEDLDVIAIMEPRAHRPEYKIAHRSAVKNLNNLAKSFG